jgi:Permuted papain-like amidase enzyme, YaeF/YiiX, C92 family
MRDIPCLPYAQIRPVIRSGDLLLCQGTSTFARLIQYATGSPWSHVACLVWLETIDRLVVLESVESIGVRAVPLSKYVDNYDGAGHAYTGRVFLGRHATVAAQPQTSLAAFSQRAIDLLGSAYDTQTILHIAARVVAAKLGFHPPDLPQDTAYICSEYVWAIYQAMGITLPYGHGGFIAPHDWAEAPDVTLLWEIDLVLPRVS